jgi:hypothetical protein
VSFVAKCIESQEIFEKPAEGPGKFIRNAAKLRSLPYFSHTKNPGAIKKEKLNEDYNFQGYDAVADVTEVREEHINRPLPISYWLLARLTLRPWR